MRAAGSLLTATGGIRRPRTPLKAPAMGKLLPEVADPSGKSWPRESEEHVQTPDGVATGSALAKRADH